MRRCDRCNRRIPSGEYAVDIHDVDFAEGVMTVCDDCANEYEVCKECNLYFETEFDECAWCGYIREGDLA